MTLKEEILQKVPQEILDTRDPEQIAAKVSEGRISYKERFVGIGTILATMAPVGGDFLNALEYLSQANSNVKWALKLIEQGSLDVGMKETREQFNAFALQTPSMAEGIRKLIELSIIPSPVSEYDVRCVLWDSDGNWLGDN